MCELRSVGAPPDPALGRRRTPFRTQRGGAVRFRARRATEHHRNRRCSRPTAVRKSSTHHARHPRSPSCRPRDALSESRALLSEHAQSSHSPLRLYQPDGMLPGEGRVSAPQGGTVDKCASRCDGAGWLSRRSWISHADPTSVAPVSAPRRASGLRCSSRSPRTGDPTCMALHSPNEGREVNAVDGLAPRKSSWISAGASELSCVTDSSRPQSSGALPPQRSPTSTSLRTRAYQSTFCAGPTPTSTRSSMGNINQGPRERTSDRLPSHNGREDRVLPHPESRPHLAPRS